MRILVVEDNSVSRDLAMHMLRQLGHDVSMVGNGREAVERQSECPFDLIVMDVWMPEMDGLEASRKIREIESARNSPRTPIIALTAHAIRGDRDACISAGMDEYLTKPIRRQTLVDAIQRVAARQNVQPAAPVVELKTVPSSPEGVSSLLGPWVGADADVLFKIGPLMIDSTRTSLADLQEALGSKSWIKLEREAHSLKGSLGIFHASSTVALVKRIEEGARRQDEGAVSTLLGLLADELVHVHREVQERCALKCA